MLYTINNKISLEEYRRLIEDIFSCLEKCPSEHENKIFIDGEFDSSQTNFEKQSNHCEIGVIANSPRVGYSLLLFLRMITDKNMNLLIWIFKNMPNIDVDMESIMKVVEKYETRYTDIFSMDEDIKRTLSSHKGEINIKVTSDDIDLWTLHRVKKAFMKKL